MHDALIVKGGRQASANNNDRELVEDTSAVMVTVILSDICHVIGKIFPGSEYQINSGIRITTVTKPIIGFFVAIFKKRSDDFGISIADGELNLKLNRTVRVEDRVLTWIKLQQIVHMHYQLLDKPYLLNNDDFVSEELIG